jgi:hypothetical protein
MEFLGSQIDVNYALREIAYTCDSSRNCIPGNHTLTVSVNDNGFTGIGQEKTATETVNLDIGPGRRGFVG